MANLSDRIPVLQAEIVLRVEAIEKQKEDKKTIVSSFNENIKYLQAERDTLLQELNATKDQVKQGILTDAADDLIEANAKPGDQNLSLLD